MAELFGFSITRLKKTADPKQSFTQPQADDGTQTVAAGGYFGQYLDMEGQAKTEQDLIRRYREIALHPECDMACLLYTSPSPRDGLLSRMPSSA